METEAAVVEGNSAEIGVTTPFSMTARVVRKRSACAFQKAQPKESTKKVTTLRGRG